MLKRFLTTKSPQHPHGHEQYFHIYLQVQSLIGFFLFVLSLLSYT